MIHVASSSSPLRALATRVADDRRTAPLNLFAAPTRACEFPHAGEFSLWVDRSNDIVFVSPGWEPFGAANFDSQLGESELLHQPVLNFVTDETTRECFRVLFERVRQEKRPARFIVRCDSEERPRVMSLVFTPMRDNAIECAWQFTYPAHGGFVGNTPRRRYQPGELLRMCSWCRAVHAVWTWQPLDVAGPSLGLLDRETLPAISHGICPECSMSLLQETEGYAAVRQAV